MSAFAISDGTSSNSHAYPERLDFGVLLSAVLTSLAECELSLKSIYITLPHRVSSRASPSPLKVSIVCHTMRLTICLLKEFPKEKGLT